MTTATSDLSGFLRSTADWVDAGGRIEFVLWAITITFGFWAIFDVVKWFIDRKRKKQESICPESTFEEYVDFDVRFRHGLNMFLHAIFGMKPIPKKRKQGRDSQE